MLSFSLVIASPTESLPNSYTLFSFVKESPLRGKRNPAATLPVGTRLEFVSSDSSEVHVRYMNTEQAIPISAVDAR
jgi:hypothetical protein